MIGDQARDHSGGKDRHTRFGLGDASECELEARPSGPQARIGIVLVRPELGRREHLEEVDLVDAVEPHAVDRLRDVFEQEVP